MNGKIKYEFSENIWQHASPGGWYFVSLPKTLAKEIRKTHFSEEKGWGRLIATAIIGSSEWKTAMWFDSKLNTYILPLKAEIRRKEHLETDTAVKVIIWI